MRFIDKRTNEIKNAFSVEQKDEMISVQFEENGKTYNYKVANIEILDDDKSTNKKLLVYSYERECWKCKKKTEILTYIVLDNENNENFLYPWDKNRLHRMQSWEETQAHMKYPQIEFYPIKTIGSDDVLDELMRKTYPDKIYRKYSKTQSRKYPMNVCQYCGAIQGEFFVYEEINKIIQKMEIIKCVEEIKYSL